MINCIESVSSCHSCRFCKGFNIIGSVTHASFLDISFCFHPADDAAATADDARHTTDDGHDSATATEGRGHDDATAAEATGGQRTDDEER